ncbi:HlyD family efflux transporter periplasmic adaptor subunit [Pseudoflavonifractor phocaeensis]|uniref:HlyD family efflux transporter periplasmic adaptor subunit n=1 Tax=Pseudoflavonifractor phocaeensis TaxID=1870988 RepID=UPI0025A404D1|nr:HlyD family efflux transporter periplasmic adaptor subunit [Pseudoflavonifractor phocaeensis]MDM8239992.1 HlyD family efflux transporter periplasmic adaptor subunit [Pseudoflavonifractor phocaeensis]
MKQGRPLITFVIALFAGALVLYAIFSVWKTFQDPFVSTYVYSYTLNDSIQTDGLIIRQEQVLSGGQGIVDVTRGEGEQVGINQTVALIYRDDQARQSQEQQEALRLEITQLQYALGQGEDVSSAAKLNDDILNAMVSLRVASTQQDFSDLEDQVLEVKGKVLRREYTYSDELSTDSLATRLQELQTQYQTLINQSYSAITQVTAPVSGTFSTLVDGYEGLINLESAINLTPQALTDLMGQNPTGDSTAVGKLISPNQWYFAAVVTQEEGERLEQAGSLTLRFAGDFTKEVSMTVEKVNQDDQGQAVVILSSDRYLEQTTLLRRETAELIFNSRTGLRVPKNALRMVTTTSEDEETGETTETNTLGVYVVTAGRAEFKPVTILTEGDDFYVVQSVRTDKKALRAGDEVIVEATGLYDGQLLLY